VECVGAVEREVTATVDVDVDDVDVVVIVAMIELQNKISKLFLG
jgi:hypothetical protein